MCSIFYATIEFLEPSFFARAFPRPTFLRISGTPTAMGASTAASIKNPLLVAVDRVMAKAMAAPTEILSDGRQSSVTPGRLQVANQHGGTVAALRMLEDGTGRRTRPG